MAFGPVSFLKESHRILKTLYLPIKPGEYIPLKSPLVERYLFYHEFFSLLPWRKPLPKDIGEKALPPGVPLSFILQVVLPGRQLCGPSPMTPLIGPSPWKTLLS